MQGPAPLGTMELAAAAALGRLLRQRRQQAGLTQVAVARAAQISVRHLRRLEYGGCRTRSSTLARLALALTSRAENADAGDWVAVHSELVEAAGVALAAESQFADRVAHRRDRRSRAGDATVDRLARVEALEGVVERRARQWLDGDGQVHRHVVFTLQAWDGARRVLLPEQVPPDVFTALPRAWGQRRRGG